MSKLVKNPRKTFFQKTRNARKKQYIKAKNQLKGKLFSTWDILDNGVQWADIFFMSEKNGFFYNVTITTAHLTWHEEIENYATSKAFDLMEGKIFTKNMTNKKTFTENVETFRKEAVEQNIVVYEEFEIDRDYCYGIGLHIVIDVPLITEDIINDTIREFKAQGEQAWRSDKPLSYDFKENGAFAVNALNI